MIGSSYAHPCLHGTKLNGMMTGDEIWKIIEVTPKCLGGLPVDRDRRNAYPGSTPCPRGDIEPVDRFNEHQSPLFARQVFRGTRLELMTRQPRVRVTITTWILSKLESLYWSLPPEARPPTHQTRATKPAKSHQDRGLTVYLVKAEALDKLEALPQWFLGQIYSDRPKNSPKRIVSEKIADRTVTNVAFQSNTGAIGDGPRYFKTQSQEEDDTSAGTPPFELLRLGIPCTMSLDRFKSY
ncbi:hypothetical protein TNCV_2915951 [Trichonephila clavipes]|nr:hypothetical protein TNCV_2915951 [Trichonephila clavipes]